MDQLKEYHDPDYPEAAVCVKEEAPSLSEDEKVEKIKSIIHREFSNELEARENEVKLIHQRMLASRRLLHRLRYSLVSSYYSDQKMQLTAAQIQDEIAVQRDPRAKAEISSTLRDGQRHIHPSVRKLLGKQKVDIDEIFRTRGPRNKTRKNYSAMLQKRNYTISADATKSLRPDSEMEPSSSQPAPVPKKVPRHMDPKITNVVTLDEATRNQMKHRYRFIIGNTSKYVPAASRLDRSTHKWLLYIRGAARAPDASPLLASAAVTLHHSYAPHHRVHLDKHPFHISRRGWGEFPAKIELHFTLPERNRPATVEHTIKLDRQYTGMQTLGSETIVDVWLYSTPEMLQYQYIEDDDHTLTDIQTNKPTETQTNISELQIKVEDISDKQTDNWMDFFKTTTELDVDEMFVKPNKPIIVKQEVETIETSETDFEEKIDSEIIQNENIQKVSIKNENRQNESIKNEKRQNESIKNEKRQNESIKNEKRQKETIKNESILQVPSEILNQPTSVKKRIVKYIDPTTGKIYYLEMDRELDLTKVQEIIINNATTKISPIKANGLKNVRKKKGGISLLKPEVKDQIKTENSIKIDRLMQNFPHLDNDHCYLANPKVSMESLNQMVLNETETEIKIEENLYERLVSVICRLTDMRSAVNHLVRRIPLISDEVRDPVFMTNFPFVVENSERYWKLDYAKRRNIEWSRAKLINTLLTEHFRHGPVWRTKQILLYIRLHGHYPIRTETATVKSESEWSPWNDLEAPGSSLKEIYPKSTDINSLSVFKFDFDMSNETIELSEDEEVDVISNTVKVNVKKEMTATSGLQVLPVEKEDDRMRFLFIERKCSDIGIELRNEDIGSGYSYSAVHAVLLSAMQSFAEELIRNSLAEKRKQESPRGAPSVWLGTTSSRTLVGLQHVYGGCQRGRIKMLSGQDTATPSEDYYAI